MPTTHEEIHVIFSQEGLQRLKRGLEQERYAVDVAYDADDGLSMALTEDYDHS